MTSFKQQIRSHILNSLDLNEWYRINNYYIALPIDKWSNFLEFGFLVKV